MNNQFNQSTVRESKSIWTIIIPIIIITAIVVGAGVWWWQKTSFEKERQELQQQIDDLKGQISGVEDWKTYQNGEYGFELQFPEAWKGYEVSSDEAGNYNCFYLEIEEQQPFCIFQLYHYSINEWENVKNKRKQVVYITKSNEFVFSYEPADCGELNEFQCERSREVSLIIDTFKLTEPINYSVYKNSDYNFEFKYPSGWTISKDMLENDPRKLHLLIMPDGHPTNKAGYLDLIGISFDAFEEQYKKVLQAGGNDIKESDFYADNISGKYYVVTHKDGTQIDYIYDFVFDNETTMRVGFNSYAQDPEKFISSILQNSIKDFVKTIKKTK